MIERLEIRRLLTGTFRVVGYLPDYEYGSVAGSLNWNSLTQVNYFSIVPSATGTLPSTSSGGYSLSQLMTTVSTAHAHGLKADIVLSGTNFPTIAASSALRSTFANNMKAFCTTYNLDGVDIDWEPDSPTAQQDTDYGNLIDSLHATAPSLDLSVAVNSGLPNLLTTLAITDLTTINVMTYDMTYAQNAPLNTTEAAMQTFATKLTNAGISTRKLNFGLPFYGRAGTSWANSTAETYNDIVNGYIQQTGSGPPASADQLNVSFANAFSGASTAWTFNGPTTIATKTQYAMTNDGGVMVWNVGQDHFSTQGQYDQYSLLPVINSVVHPPATQAVFAQQPANVELGSTISPAVTVDIESANGSIVTTDSSSVMLSISSGPQGASLGAYATVAAVNGVATFSKLAPTIAGTYTLTASDGSLAAAASHSFQVTNPPATQLMISQQPTNDVVGNVINPAVTVNVDTAAGYIAGSDSSNVTLKISSGPTGAVLGGSTTIAAVRGVATFTNLAPSVAGTYILTASDGVLSAAISQSFQVVSALPAWVSSNGGAAYSYASHTLTVTGSATIIGDPGSDLPVINAMGSSAQISIALTAGTQIHLGSLNLSGGAAAALPAYSTTPLILLTGSVSIDSSSQLDLGNNVMDVSSGDLANLSRLTSRGFNAAGGGDWRGTGITSSAAAGNNAHLTALASMVNNNGTSSPIIASIDGATLSSTDVLIKYTYVGDATLDGAVDGSDYSRIDNGFLNQLSGWTNGDFNADGVVDGSDYTLIDNAFNSQGQKLVNPAALIGHLNLQTGSVEPAANLPISALAEKADVSAFMQKKPKVSLMAALLAAMQVGGASDEPTAPAPHE